MPQNRLIVLGHAGRVINKLSLAVRALTSRFISLAGVKWACLRIEKPAPPPRTSTSTWPSAGSATRTSTSCALSETRNPKSHTQTPQILLTLNTTPHPEAFNLRPCTRWPQPVVYPMVPGHEVVPSHLNELEVWQSTHVHTNTQQDLMVTRTSTSCALSGRSRSCTPWSPGTR